VIATSSGFEILGTYLIKGKEQDKNIKKVGTTGLPEFENNRK